MSPLEPILPFLLVVLCTAASGEAPAGSPPEATALDPKQIEALQSLGISTARDPCGSPSPHNNATACDGSAPFRHLVSLNLSDCPPDLDIPASALLALSTLRSLSFTRCPAPAPRLLPAPLASSLNSFTCSSSLRRLSGVFLSRLHNLTHLSVTSVPVTASGLYVIVSDLPNLRSLTISSASLPGSLPRHWHSPYLNHIDLSGNNLDGPIHSSISILAYLQSLDLSFNGLNGSIPDTIGDLIELRNLSLSHNSIAGPLPASIATISSLAHLDLSSNRFNGTIPSFLSTMGSLKSLNLEDNDFRGVIPFNASFIKKLDRFKVSGNANLCYNHTLLSSTLKLGIAKCDRFGLPVPPSPDRSSHEGSSDYGDDGGGASFSDGGGERSHGPSVIVLAVAIVLSCLVFVVMFIVCLSRRCKKTKT